MSEPDPVQALLEEIRDLQKEHLAEYRKQAARSISIAEDAVSRQKAHIVLYRKVLAVTAIVLVSFIACVWWIS